MNDFNIALKKGEIGEQIIREYLVKEGYIVYKIINNNGSHRFDFFVDHLEKECFAADVKTKARLNKWARQGIDTIHYINYMKFAEDQNVAFILFFIDDKNGDVHAANIKKIEDEMYIANGRIITWPIANMNFLFKLSDGQINQLSQYDQRNYDYNPTLF